MSDLAIDAPAVQPDDGLPRFVSVGLNPRAACAWRDRNGDWRAWCGSVSLGPHSTLEMAREAIREAPAPRTRRSRRA